MGHSRIHPKQNLLSAEASYRLQFTTSDFYNFKNFILCTLALLPMSLVHKYLAAEAIESLGSGKPVKTSTGMVARTHVMNLYRLPGILQTIKKTIIIKEERCLSSLRDINLLQYLHLVTGNICLANLYTLNSLFFVTVNLLNLHSTTRN